MKKEKKKYFAQITVSVYVERLNYVHHIIKDILALVTPVKCWRVNAECKEVGPSITQD